MCMCNVVFVRKCLYVNKLTKCIMILNPFCNCVNDAYFHSFER